MKNKRTSEDVRKELAQAEEDLRQFQNDKKHYFVSERAHIGGGCYVGGTWKLRDEYSIWNSALLERIDNLKTLCGMYVCEELKEKE